MAENAVTDGGNQPHGHLLDLDQPDLTAIRYLHSRDMSVFDTGGYTSYDPIHDEIAILQDADPADRFRFAVGMRVGYYVEFEIQGDKPETFDVDLMYILQEPSDSVFSLERDIVRMEIGFNRAEYYFFDDSAAEKISQFLKSGADFGAGRKLNNYSRSLLKFVADQYNTKMQILNTFPEDVLQTYRETSTALFALISKPEYMPGIDNERAEIRHEKAHQRSYKKWNGGIKSMHDTNRSVITTENYKLMLKSVPKGQAESFKTSWNKLKSVYQFMNCLLESEAIVYESLGNLPGKISANTQPDTMVRFTMRIADLLADATHIENGAKQTILADLLVKDADYTYSEMEHVIGTFLLIYNSNIKSDALEFNVGNDGISLDKLLRVPVDTNTVIRDLDRLMKNPNALLGTLQDGLLVVEHLQMLTLTTYLQELYKISDTSVHCSIVVRESIVRLEKVISEHALDNRKLVRS